MLRQEESLSISKASTWGVRRRFEQGKIIINEKSFLGYDKDEQGNLIINKKQADIVKRIYKDFLDGKGTGHITRELEQEKIKNCNGTTKWYESTIKSILQNEKYKGDALLQKSYTIDFLSKKRAKNNGEVPQYYVEESHPAIIDSKMWEAVQLEMQRRKTFCEEHGIKKLDTTGAFAGKIICGNCGVFCRRKTWMAEDGKDKRKVWMCSNRYRTKGIKGCESKYIDEEVLKEVFVTCFNTLLENKQHFLKKWQGQIKEGDVLKRYRLKELIKVIEDQVKLEEFEEELCLKMLKQITVANGKQKVIVELLDGTTMECEK